MKTKLNEEEKDDKSGSEAENQDSLLDDLENLDDADESGSDAGTDKDESASDDTASEEANDESTTDEPEQNIVDMFTKGDMDGVKQHIQDKVVAAVSDIVNAPVSTDDTAGEEASGEETDD